jgi:glycosyltransferase involved in cell wall biosynthesis
MADKLLLIACHFPPGGGIQVQRALSLAKYLPQNGFDVHVLTTRYPQVPHYDPGLLRHIPDSVKVHRTWSFEPPFHLRKRIWSLFGNESGSGANSAERTSPSSGIASKLKGLITSSLSPDPQRLWYPFALRCADLLIERESIRYVLVTAPPFSTFLIGNELKKRHPSISLVSEFRDEWLDYFLNTFAFRDETVRLRAAEIERETVECSDSIVAVTPTALRAIRGRYPDHPKEKFRLIPNGYDPQAFADFQPRSHGTNKIVITFAGTVYRPSSPAVFLNALDRLPDEVRSHFETRFVGRIADEMDAAIFQNRRSTIKLLGFVHQEQAFRYMEETDYLLLPWNDRLNVPGKLYEYLATNKPVIALVPPESDSYRVLADSGLAQMADPEDGDAIAQMLMKIGLTGGPVVQANAGAIVKFQRPRLVAQYAALIRQAPAAEMQMDSFAALVEEN